MEKIIADLWEWVSMELTDFVNFLDFYYAMAYLAYIAGINYSKTLDWINIFFNNEKLMKGRDSIVAIILVFIFCIFRAFGENKFNSDYIASLLMTGLISVSSGFILIKWLKKKANDKGKKG